MDETAAAEKKFTDAAAPIIAERTVKYVKAEKDKLVAGTAADNVWRNDTALAWANLTAGDLKAPGNVQRGLASASNLLADQTRAAIAETKALWWQGHIPSYLQWSMDVGAHEAPHTATTTDNMVQLATLVKNAGVDYAKDVGTAIKTFETAVAAARSSYVITVMPFYRNATDKTLKAHRDLEMDMADAELNKQLTGNHSAYEQAVKAANDLHTNTVRQANEELENALKPERKKRDDLLPVATKDKEAASAKEEREYQEAIAAIDAQYGSASSNGDTGVEGATRRSAIKTRDAQYYAARDTSWANTLSGSTTLGTSPWTVKAITAANGQAAFSTSRASAQAAHDAAMLDAMDDWQLSSRESLTDLLFTEGQSRETYNVATSNVYANWENGVGNLLGDKPEGTGWFVSGKAGEESTSLSPKKNGLHPTSIDELATTGEETNPQDDELDRPDVNESELPAELQEAVSEYNKLLGQGLEEVGNRRITTEELNTLLEGIPGLQVYRGDDIVIVTIDDHQFVFVYESLTEYLDGPMTGTDFAAQPTRTVSFWSYKGRFYNYKTKTLLEHHADGKTLASLQRSEMVLTTTLHLLPGGTLGDKLANGTDDNAYYVALITAGDLTLVGGLYFKATTRIGKAVLITDVAVNGVGAGAAAYQYANSEEGRAAHAGEFILRLAAMGLGANSLRLSRAQAKIANASSKTQSLEKVAENAPNGAFGNRSVGAAETPLERYFENEVIERMNGQFPTSESWELISLSKPQAMSEVDYLIGPNQKRYYARFYDHVDESYTNISINYDPITGELGIIKKSSRQ